jgi:TctA family transporter
MLIDQFRHYPLPPLMLAIVLGHKAEESFRQPLLISQAAVARRRLS